MATKTISLHLDAYEKLRAARRRPSESFSQVILRARWPEESITAAELARRYRERGGFLAAEDLDRIDELKGADVPPADKWGPS
ncbi:MAG: antitoxin VapB family protein [Acidobacteriota bacterium]|nr:antitoxin VapB family protein [Acidobacteriota bacterium]MDH3523590.1 antitoxin VapB family protein [Acidobacteriota bacterium]